MRWYFLVDQTKAGGDPVSFCFAKSVWKQDDFSFTQSKTHDSFPPRNGGAGIRLSSSGQKTEKTHQPHLWSITWSWSEEVQLVSIERNNAGPVLGWTCSCAPMPQLIEILPTDIRWRTTDQLAPCKQFDQDCA